MSPNSLEVEDEDEEPTVRSDTVAPSPATLNSNDLDFVT